MTFTAGAQCTANFVFTQGARRVHRPGRPLLGHRRGHRHQRLRLAGSLPLGTPGRGRRGQPARHPRLQLVAHHAGRRARPNADACAYNDLALIRLDPADHAKVNPSIPTYGGPTGVGGATAAGDRVYSYGNSSLRQGVAVLSPKTGISLGTTGNGWTHPVYTRHPGHPR